ncbi:uncharacterized protein LOC130648690 [Hydractinia symbiolongicarpus]|uniref:uncharacterized protein LOC130648690 n=1 Tax=Hydractinia symbiolongicarpus TaxID=13093 RepID=UPI0025500BC7|nr:uncharacterized protein LOC130648690 [Hydractinia symbiolongicarpus]
MISVQAYRATIGSFYNVAASHSKNIKNETMNLHNHAEMLFDKVDNNNFNSFLKLFISVIFMCCLSCNISLASLKLMLLLSGDVESNPGPFNNNDIDFQISLQESYATHLLNQPNSADHIVAYARSIGLSNITYRELTIGDGNCFYRAVVQQLNRPEIRQIVSPELHFQNHLQLRAAVVKFVRKNSNLSIFQNNRDFLSISPEEWERDLQIQSRSTVDVVEIFIRAASIMLGVNILITSDTSTAIHPYTLISPTHDETHNIAGEQQMAHLLTDGTTAGAFILLGRVNENHYQSLVFDDNVSNPSVPSSTPLSPSKKIPRLSSKYPENITNQKPGEKKVTTLNQNQDLLVEKIMKSYMSTAIIPTRVKPKSKPKPKPKPKPNYNKEPALKLKCLQLNIKYEEPKVNETSIETINRHRRISYSCKKNVSKTAMDKQKNANLKKPPACKRTCAPPPNTLPIITHNQVNNLPTTQSVPTIVTDNQTTDQDQIYGNETSTIHQNPDVVAAVIQFEEGEKLHSLATCKTCRETRPVFHATPPISPTAENETKPITVKPWKIFSDERCDRCHRESLSRFKKNVTTPARFSGILSVDDDDLGPLHDNIRHNDMHFLPVPPYLQNLTILEVALIRRITVIMNIHLLRYGMLASKGHCISFPQRMQIAKELPSLPSQVGIVVIKKKGTRNSVQQYTVQRGKVENALRGLCFGYPEGGTEYPDTNSEHLYNGSDHIDKPLKGRYFQFLPNEYYKDVSIKYDRIQNLPEMRSELPGLPVVEMPHIIPEEDKGPAENQFLENLPQDDESITRSGLVCPLESKDADKELRTILQKLLGSEDAVNQALEHGTIANANLEFTREQPIRELKTPGFFTMAYPTVFINGNCDLTVPRLSKINFEEYIEHIYYCSDNRVARHPYLKFFLLNMRLRMQALQQGSFLVSQQLNDAHLTIAELRDNLQNDDDSVPRKIISIGKNLVNTDPYWRDQKKKVDALLFFRRKEFGDLPGYFDTNSCAEFHWKPLHELLIKYHALINNLNEDTVRQQMENDSKFKREMILQNLHIVTQYFDARTINYFATVDKKVFQYNDSWWRYEFAKGRGEIHGHAIISSSKHAQKVKTIMDGLSNDVPDSQASQTAAQELQNWLQTTNEDSDDIFSPIFTSLHPAGGNEIIDTSGIRTWVPNKNQWPTPEGSQAPPDHNPLAQELADVANHEGGIREQHTYLVNRIGLHNCNSSCLRYRRKNNKEKDTAPKKYCRFHFGDLDPQTKKTSGKEIHPFHAVITKGEHPRYEGPRDHPRLMMHVKTRLLSWLANCDSQVIIDQDLLALQKYIAGYACKGAASTEDLVHVYRHLIENTADGSTVKNLAQRLLQKIAGLVDVPGAAADFINSGGRLTRCTRNFRYIGISGFRALDTSGEDGTVTKNSTLDKYLSDKRRETEPEISLWNWSKKCNCTCKVDHVPVFTGISTKPVWPVTEDYAKAMLVIFSVGTWHNTEELKGQHESFAAALASFVQTENCPPILIDALKEAKQSFDKKSERKQSHTRVINNETDNQSSCQSSQYTDASSQSSQNSVIAQMNIGRAIMRDIARHHVADINEPDVQQVLPNGGPTFDWNNYAIQSFGSQWPINADTWLQSISEEAERNELQLADVCTLPQINILNANELQRTVIGINLQHLLQVAKGTLPTGTQPLRLLIQGTAGVGKTFIITALTRIVRRIFKRNSAVMNLAPTGAASVLIPNGRTIHSMTPPPHKLKKDKNLNSVQLSDYPLGDVSLRKLRKYTGMHENNELKLFQLNIDERSMQSKLLVAWCSQRLCEATGDFDNYYGGVPAVNFFGDLGQLGPIRALDLHQPPKHDDSTINFAGYAIYRSFQDVIVLTETMRQGPDQLALLQRLLRIRNGSITQQDWQDINSRYEDALPQTEKCNFSHGRVLTLMETWNEVNEENHNKLASLGVPVAVIPSRGRGKHHSLTDKQLGQIPLRSLMAVGATVILTKNQKGLTGLGLNNGAMGKVIAILYSPNMSPPEFPIAVIVDFPNYKGPIWIPEHPTWIPITAVEGRCESNCCSRNGLPLMPGYAITIAKSQGMSIGDGKTATHMRIKLQQSIQMEKNNLGTAYTAFSRCEKERNWALVEPITQERLLYVNTHPRMKARQEEEQRLKALSNETIKKFDITIVKYINLLKDLDEFCDDDIEDAVCPSPSADCSCIICTSQS